MPKPIPKPSRAEEVLATVAARYSAGATVTLPAIAGVWTGKRDRSDIAEQRLKEPCQSVYSKLLRTAQGTGR